MDMWLKLSFRQFYCRSSLIFSQSLFKYWYVHYFIFAGLSLMQPTRKISMLSMVFYLKTLKCWNLWNFKMKCIKTLQIGNQQSMKIMISSLKLRGAAPGHRRLKEKGTLGISIFGPKLARFWPNNEDETFVILEKTKCQADKKWAQFQKTKGFKRYDYLKITIIVTVFFHTKSFSEKSMIFDTLILFFSKYW